MATVPVLPPVSHSLVSPQFSTAEAHAFLRIVPKRLLQAQAKNDSVRQWQLHWGAGQAYHTLHRYGAALRHYRQALTLSQPNKHSYAWSQWLIGRTLYSQGDTGKARQSYQYALNGFRQLRDVAGQAQVLEQLGELHSGSEQWARARQSYEQALSAWQLAHNNQRVSRILNRIGQVHQQQHNFSRALYYLRQSLVKAHESQDSAQISEALAGTGQVYTKVGNQEVARNFYTRALASLPVSAAPLTRANLHQSLATAHDSLGNLAAAVQQLQQATGPAAQTGSKALLSKVYYSLASLYRRQGSAPKALAALTRYTQLQDSVFVEQRSAEVAELQTRYETEKKEREIQLLLKDSELQEADLRRQKLQRNWLAVGTVLLLVAVAALYRAQQQQRQTNGLLQLKNAAINKQKEELDRLNQTKDTLFSIISHDLRGPLSSLYSLLALLKLGRLSPERLASQSERVTRMLDSTLHLLDNLLNWSAAQLKGGIGTRPERVRLDVLVEETVALFHSDAERKGIELQSQVPDGCVVRADVNMTRLVLRNLLNNALKFTPAGGAVSLMAEQKGRWWQVSVKDTGVGIDPVDFPRVLGLGIHFSTLGTAREKGTGLGLRLCREFVERNEGELTFSSELGKGSVFRFTLPIMDETIPVTGTGSAVLPKAASRSKLPKANADVV